MHTCTHAHTTIHAQILPDYYDHVEDNPDTLLCRLFALLRIRSSRGRSYLLVMGNVLDTERDIHEVCMLVGRIATKLCMYVCMHVCSSATFTRCVCHKTLVSASCTHTYVYAYIRRDATSRAPRCYTYIHTYVYAYIRRDTTSRAPRWAESPLRSRRKAIYVY